MNTVKAVEYIDGYRLKLLFDDKKIKIVDLTNLVKKGGWYFKPLQDIEFFKQVSLDDDEYPSSIRWPNDADICPDVLYEMGTEVKEPKPRKVSGLRPRRATMKRQTLYALSKRRKASK